MLVIVTLVVLLLCGDSVASTKEHTSTMPTSSSSSSSSSENNLSSSLPMTNANDKDTFKGMKEKNDEEEDEGKEEMEIVLESIDLPRVLLVILGAPIDSSIERMKAQVNTFVTRPEIDVLFVTSKVTHTMLGVKEADQHRVKFLALPIELDVVSRNKLPLKMLEAWVRINEEYGGKYDYFFKVDDDTFVNPESVVTMLTHYDKTKPVYLGRRVGTFPCRICKDLMELHVFAAQVDTRNFFHGGGGYVMSDVLLGMIAPRIAEGTCYGYRKKWEDAIVSTCIGQHLGSHHLNLHFGFDPLINNDNQTENVDKILHVFSKNMVYGNQLSLFNMALSFHSIQGQTQEILWGELNQSRKHIIDNILLSRSNSASIGVDEKSFVRDSVYQEVLRDAWGTKLSRGLYHQVINFECVKGLQMCAALMLQRSRQPAAKAKEVFFYQGNPPAIEGKTAVTLLRVSKQVWDKIKQDWEDVSNEGGQQHPQYHTTDSVEVVDSERLANIHPHFNQVVVVVVDEPISAEDIGKMVWLNLRFSFVVVVFKVDSSKASHDSSCMLGDSNCDRDIVGISKDYMDALETLLLTTHRANGLLFAQVDVSVTPQFYKLTMFPPMFYNLKILSTHLHRAIFSFGKGGMRASPLLCGLAYVFDRLGSVVHTNAHVLHVRTQPGLTNFKFKANMFLDRSIFWESITMFEWDKRLTREVCPREDRMFNMIMPNVMVGEQLEYQWYLYFMMHMYEFEEECTYLEDLSSIVGTFFPTKVDVRVLMNRGQYNVAMDDIKPKSFKFGAKQAKMYHEEQKKNAPLIKARKEDKRQERDEFLSRHGIPHFLEYL
eukprot:m.118503 g.118503  ORF g.118503 m.118503 type:complete len:826 (+) comp12897_c0_seq1:131-2608(+)